MPQLRALLQPGNATLLPGAFNAMAARMVQQAGFGAVYLTGAGVTNSHLGAPDLGLITATEMASQIAACREAVELPIIADGDTGFGNPLNVVRTVRLYERAGATAIQLEDQVFPKRCGHFDGKEVIPLSEMVQKVKAAADARVDADFLIIARTDARAIEGLQGALERAAAYREAGADVLFVEAPQSEAEMRAIPQALPGPHLCNIVHGGKTPMLPQPVLADMGFAGVLYANAALQSAMLAISATLRHLREAGSLAGIEDHLIGFGERQQIVDFDRWMAVNSRYADPA